MKKKKVFTQKDFWNAIVRLGKKEQEANPDLSDDEARFQGMLRRACSVPAKDLPDHQFVGRYPVNRPIRIGRKTMVAKEWSKISGVPTKTILDRMSRSDWSPERAVYEPVAAGRRAVLYEWNGEALTLNQWAERSGLSRSVLDHRVRAKGMTVGAAIELGRQSVGRKASGG